MLARGKAVAGGDLRGPGAIVALMVSLGPLKCNITVAERPENAKATQWSEGLTRPECNNTRTLLLPFMRRRVL